MQMRITTMTIKICCSVMLNRMLASEWLKWQMKEMTQTVMLQLTRMLMVLIVADRREECCC